MADDIEHQTTRVQLCGRFAVEIEGRPVAAVVRGRQARLLFSYLVLHRERPVRRDELVEALWPADGNAPESPDGALRTLVSRLRAVLGADVIRGRAELTLELPAGASVDVESAFDEIERAERALARSCWEEAIGAADLALAVVVRGFLADVDASWVQAERRRLDEVRLRALECLAAGGLGLGGARLSVTERAARRLIEAAPYRETGYRYLMQALAERGRVAEALQVFEEIRRLLRDQLGTPPGPGLRALHERLLSERGHAPREESGDPLAVGSGATEPARPALFAPSPALAGSGGDAFVGREEHLERLWRLYEDARAGSRRVAFVRGEPGIGKTRLATELARRAHREGAIVLYGRCDEEPLVPYQPFVEALGHYVTACPPAELAAQVDLGSGELRRLVPQLAERLPDLAPPLAGDPEGERYRLFESVTSLLRRAAATRPVVLVLDDLHWADKPTLLLLKQVVRCPRATALIVLGTYREAGVEPGHPLSGILADIGREAGLERLPLAALDLAAVAMLVRSHAGDQPPELVRTVFEDSEGNPFFVVEMLRHLQESGAVAGAQGRRIPDSVVDLIGQRVAGLSEPARDALSIASVCGRDFAFAVLGEMSELGADRLVAAVDEAVRARVIEELAGVAGGFTFTHALIRETIYGRLGGPRRAQLHRRVAASLAAVHAADLDAHRAELAHHLAQAGSAADLAQAIEHAARAGDRAGEQLAYEQAAAHYRHALRLIEAVGISGRLQARCDLVIAQGEAERRAGEPAFRATLLEGARLAQELGDAARLARAALANNRGFFSAMAGVDGGRVAVLESALAMHGAQDSAVHATLLAQLALELTLDPDWRRPARLSDAALAMARRVGDARTLVRTLCFRYVALWGPRTLPERLSNAGEAGVLAERLADPLLHFQAARFGSHAAMESGDLALADRLLERQRELAGQLGQPIIDWYHTVTCAKRRLISGAPAEADRLARDGFEIGRGAAQPDAALWLTIQRFISAFLQGTLARARTQTVDAAPGGSADAGFEATPSRSVPILLAALQTAAASEAGRVGEAGDRLAALMRDDLRDLPNGWAALVVPSLASVACARLGDVARAQRLYAMIEPHAGQFVDSGPGWFGAATHHLANLAATLGRHGEAGARFADAVEVYARLGADAWLERARLDWARARSRAPDAV